MASPHALGKKGEEIACSYLAEHGYRILEQNWRFRHTEIDLIAFKEETMVFVEVKTRLGNRYGMPEESVGWKKQNALKQASAAYLRRSGHEGELRFDIIAITFPEERRPGESIANPEAASGKRPEHPGDRAEGPPYELYHIQDAFFPGL